MESYVEYTHGSTSDTMSDTMTDLVTDGWMLRCCRRTAQLNTTTTLETRVLVDGVAGSADPPIAVMVSQT